MPPASPIRMAGHSPYSRLHAVHPPRTPEPTALTQAAPGAALGLALLWCAACLGLIAGLTLTAYWREILGVAVMFCVSAACGLFVHAIDRRAR